ncbi:MAG: alpha-amylase family glycosyl hydrolase [Bacteroidales bacterium]
MRPSRFTILLTLTSFLLFTAGCNKKETSSSTAFSPFIVIPDPPQYETPFANIPLTSDITMYEINERAFSQSGDFPGIISRLDSIKDLGINVIWLMPIHPIGVLKSINSPYCVRNYREVNPEYGNLASLRNLVREAHNRNIAVILDWVANHTSWDNLWISGY